MLSDGDLTVHCNRKLGAPLPPPSALRPLRTANLGRNDYYIHSAPMTSVLRYNGDNTLTRVEELDGKVFFEQYDHRGLMLEQRIVAACDQELPIFGGCYLGEDRNFLVFGQANPEESDERGALSDCQPIVKDGAVLWYFTDGSMPLFCSIDPAHPETLNLQKADFPKPHRNFYTVTVDGQTYADIEEGSVLANFLPEVSEKPDHRFLGWFHGETRVDGDTVVHSDMVLVPRWEESFPTCTVTVDGVVHSGVRVGTPLADLLPELPEKSGHSLVWMEGGSVVEPSATVRRDMVLAHDWVFDVFNDVGESDWYYNGVKYTTFRGLFRGVSPVSFGPAVKMNRAMVVQVLYSMAGKPPVAKTHQFKDVKDADWFAEAVAWAVENGVASGYGGGQFGSEDVINRAQLAVMLHGYAKKPAAQGGLSFADEADISPWARNAMQWAVKNHIMSGVGGNRISPNTTASRAEAAVMIMQFHKLMTE